jgi:beta-lactamase class D/beta-lactamase regulating signal transducer with metallopeptidase domain
MPPLFEASLRIVPVAVCVALVLALGRIHSAKARHAAWAAVLATMLLLPIVLVWTPRARVTLLPAAVQHLTPDAAVTQPLSRRAAVAPPITVEDSPERQRSHRGSWLWGIYGVGVLILFVRLAIGTLWARRLIRTASPREGHLTHAACVAPITVGWLKPVVIFPHDWWRWPAPFRTAAAAHEYHHARRRDPLVQWLALLNRVIFWFHPLAWWLERRVRQLAEEACDAAVVASGIDPAEYSRCLLHVAGTIEHGGGVRIYGAGLGVRGGHLAQRVRSILTRPQPEVATRRRLTATAMSAAVLGALCVAVTPLPASDLPRVPPEGLAQYFGDLRGTFVLLDGRTGRYMHHNATRARERFSPCSTFKVPYAAMFLETGVVPGPDVTVPYDPALRQPAIWASDQTLRSALKVSANWYFEQMGARLADERALRFVQQFDYGGGVASNPHSSDVEPFWMNGALRISADEQVRFLRRLYDGVLGLSERSTRLTKEMMLTEIRGGARLSAKTGACRPQGEETSNWYVGFVERPDNVYFFALQMGDADYGRAYSGRIPITRAILSALGIFPTAAPSGGPDVG